LAMIIFNKKEKTRDPLTMFSVANIKHFCLQILHGLRYLHHKQVAHRDLKVSPKLIRIF
jgi:serine/threonine protein kinase